MPTRPIPTSLSGLPIQVDYTARDFEAIRQELLFIVSELTPEWTDKEPGDIGVTILEAVAYVADILSYQLDRAQNESYLATAQTRESVMHLLRLIGYEMSPASPASVAMAVTVSGAVTLPAGFKVRTSDNVGGDVQEYTLGADVTLAGAGTYCAAADQTKVNTALGINSAIANENLIFTAGRQVTETLGVSDGTPNQVYQLSNFPVCIGPNDDLTINVGGTAYTSKTRFVGESATAEVFIFRFDEAQNAFVIFGDGVNGKVPPANDAIQATYRVDGGSEGNRAGVGSITSHDVLSGVTSVYNPNQPSGGTDPETVQEAKKNGPRSLRALDRCVTLDDYESMALLTPGGGVKAARAVTGESPLDVDLYISMGGTNPVPNGSWYPAIQAGFGVIGAVGRFINDKKPAPTRLSVFPPTVVNPYIQAIVYVHTNMLRQTVELQVDLALQVLFNTITDEFGEDVPLSSITQVIENTQGVNYVDITAFHRKPELKLVQGDKDTVEATTFTITDNVKMKKQKYTLNWISSNSFNLTGDTLGAVKDASGNLAVFTDNAVQPVIYYNLSDSETASQDTHFSLNLVFAANPVVSAGDIWEFSVDNYLGNIETAPHEIVVAPVDSTGRITSTCANLTYTGGI